jgi:SAM-dependent methyltransferase
MTIDYDHSENRHTLAGTAAAIAGAEAALPHFVANRPPKSLLDVGCGTGTWVRAALRKGISDVYGVDGANIDEDTLLFSKECFRQQDLTLEWSLGRRFDVALCLEVAEHLSPSSALVLIKALVSHSDVIVFSGACPGQAGQHHINCRWPEYWQGLFNAHGYVCDDSARWSIWDNDDIDPWYRQNTFVATRAAEAGREPRIKSVIHPQMIAGQYVDLKVFQEQERTSLFAQLESGAQSVWWYLALPVRAYVAKLRRRFRNDRR